MINDDSILILGLGGIGRLYNRVCNTLLGEDRVYTVDPNPAADAMFTEIPEGCKFKLGIICTPNYLHESQIKFLLSNNICKIVMVEKPGVVDVTIWEELQLRYPDRLIMAKNNCYRPELYDAILNSHGKSITSINLNWICKDRVPSPGSWFTNSKQSLGGVSVDLMPHLINVATELLELFPSGFDQVTDITAIKQQLYTLSDVNSTEYGTINKDGIYDVDDQAVLQFQYENIPITLVAAWKSNLESDSIKWSITFSDDSVYEIELGLCPETAYESMIANILENQHTEWHIDLDMFTHKLLSAFKVDSFDIHNYTRP